MRIAHLLHHLNPYGTERVVLALLKYRSSAFAEQFVVSTQDGAAAQAMRATGCKVFIETEPARLIERLATADLINAHCLYVDRGREMVAVMRPTRKPYLFTLHWPTRFPLDLSSLYICTSVAAARAQLPTACCEIVPNGIDLTPFAAPRSTVQKDRVIITRICRPEKSGDYFWYAMADVLSRHPEVDLRIVGSQGTAGGRVQAMGVCEDIAGVLADTDLFVYTPKPGEGTKDLVVMEAMAMGVPCVLSDVETTRASAVQGKTALLVPYGNTEALVASIETLLGDTALRHEFGEAARHYAVTHFDVRHRVQRYEAIYLRYSSGGYGVQPSLGSHLANWRSRLQSRFQTAPSSKHLVQEPHP